jgi:tRNA-specific 2-thiouridylase
VKEPGAPVLVAMSGGVDSSVAAALLHRAGRRVIGVSLRLHDASTEGGAGRCCSPEDFRDARLVAGALGFSYFVLDYEKRFREAVLSRFVEEYRRGRTPSPCVACNTEVKFGTLLDQAAQVGAGTVATGHYARIREGADGRAELHSAVDAGKDQSYFLFGLTQEQLHGSEFPVGDMTKAEVREAARALGLAVAEKPESQDICFVPDGDYRAVVEREAGDLGPAGEVVTAGGERLGRHAGVAGFTVGQRRGLGVASGDRLYVLQILPESGTVVVGGREGLLASGLEATGWNWIDGEEPDCPVEGSVKIRYRHPGVRAKARPLGGGCVRIHFDEPQRAVTPGQAAVLYSGTRVLGGGWIDRALQD